MRNTAYLDLEKAILTGQCPYKAHTNYDAWSHHYQKYMDDLLKTHKELYEEDTETFISFLKRCAGRSSLIMDEESIAEDCSISDSTAKKWLEALSASVLYSFDSLTKDHEYSQYYLHDSGFLCWLLSIKDPKEIKKHPCRQGIFRSWIIAQLTSRQSSSLDSSLNQYCYYQGPHSGKYAVLKRHKTGATLIDTSHNMTAKSDHLYNAKVVQEELLSQMTSTIIVFYAGERPWMFRENKLLPWKDVWQEGLFD